MEKPVEQMVTVLAQHRLRMELEPHHRMPRVLDGHDLAVLRRSDHSQDSRESRPRNDQRVVPRRRERVRDPGEDSATVVPDERGLAVNRSRRAHDPSAVRCADALVPEAYPEDRRRGPVVADDVHGDTRLHRRTGPWRDDDVGRPERRDLFVRRGVVASDHRLLPQLAHVAREVIDKGVVVVDEQDHGASAAITPRALSSVSAYSAAGSESATIPPPAWKHTSAPRTRQVRIAMLVSRAPVTLQYPIAPQ